MGGGVVAQPAQATATAGRTMVIQMPRIQFSAL